jgi:hypothetical protein
MLSQTITAAAAPILFNAMIDKINKVRGENIRPDKRH